MWCHSATLRNDGFLASEMLLNQFEFSFYHCQVSAKSPKSRPSRGLEDPAQKNQLSTNIFSSNYKSSGKQPVYYLANTTTLKIDGAGTAVVAQSTLGNKTETFS